MPNVRRVAAIATDLTCQAVGRRTVVRAARYVLSRARLDFPNNTQANCESAVQGWILRYSLPGERLYVADVGANVGRWSQSMLAAAARVGRSADLRLHAFEPAPAAFAQFTQALEGAQADLSRIALSDRAGTAVLHVVGPAAGTNSLYPVIGTDTGRRESRCGRTALRFPAGSRTARCTAYTPGGRFGRRRRPASSGPRPGYSTTCTQGEVTGVNARLFEAAGCGAAVLTEFRPVVPALFASGEGVLTFREFDELVEQASRLLHEPGLTARLGDAAARREHRDHTLAQRVTTIIEKVA